MTVHSRRVIRTAFALGILPGAAPAINSSQSPQILPRAQMPSFAAQLVRPAQSRIAAAIVHRHGAGGFTVELLTFVMPVINLSRATLSAFVSDCAVNGWFR